MRGHRMVIRPGPETNIFSISKKISGRSQNPEIPVDKAETDFLRSPCDGAECESNLAKIPVGGKERK